MLDLLASRESLVHESLREIASSVRSAGYRRWSMALPSVRSVRAIARMEDDWLLLAVPLREKNRAAERAWHLLRWNADLAGGVKLALSPGQPALRACAEIPLDDGVDLSRRVRQAAAGLKQAFACFHDTDWMPEPPAAESRPSHDWPRLVEECGWPATEKSGRFALVLDVPRDFFQASFEPRIDGGARLWIELAGTEVLSPLCRQAAALLLLKANATLRMVRAAADEDNATLRWEMSWTDSPAAMELNHALAALSLACRLTAREVRALDDELLAREYLAVQGCSL